MRVTGGLAQKGCLSETIGTGKTHDPAISATAQIHRMIREDIGNMRAR